VLQDSDFRHFLSEGKQDQSEVTAINPLMSVRDFKLLRVIGKGSYAKVLQVRMKSNKKIYAMKILLKQHLVSRNVADNAMVERKILAELRHPFLVKLHYAFQTHDKLYLVVDYFNGGELFFHLRKDGAFTEDRARFYAAEVVLAVEYLHQQGIIYRDLKPENILLDKEGHLRLTDFGLSKDQMEEDQKTKTFCGTPSYASPEMLRREAYNKMVDWWSVGILIYEMLAGHPPFRHRSPKIMFDHILNSPVQYPSSMTADAKSLIEGLLKRDPNVRLGANSAQEIKNHPWFQDVDWQRVFRKQVPVPFIPRIDPKQGDADVTNVAREFKNQPPQDTPAVYEATLHTKLAFQGFTFHETKEIDMDNSASFSANGGSASGDADPDEVTESQREPHTLLDEGIVSKIAESENLEREILTY
jgi:serine/threonine protein kinase